MTEKNVRKGNAWGRFLLIWMLFLLVLGGTGCYVLYQYLGVYEITRPEPVMDAFMENTDVSELVRMAKENVQLDLTEYEDPQELYSSYLDAIDLSRTLNYRQDDAQSSAQQLVYVVRAGSNRICDVVLTPDGTSPGFGRQFWQIKDVRSAPITELLPSLTAVIDVVSGTELNINGIPLSDAYLDGAPEPIDSLTRFESSLETVPSFLEYHVGPLYGNVQISDQYGNSIAPDGDVTDGIAHYQAFGGTTELRISAPEDLDVFINGVKLERQDVASSSYGVLEGLELYTQDAATKTNLYQITGLYLPPVVTARDADGSEVKPIASAGNSFTFFHKNDPDLESQVLNVAQRYFDAYMDYSSHAFDYTRYSNLLERILPQSDLYQYVSSSQEAMYWASGTQTAYNDLRYENFHQVSDYCFVCTVIYSADMTATNWYEQYSYKLENAYELSFVSTSGRWLAAGMNVITGA